MTVWRSSLPTAWQDATPRDAPVRTIIYQNEGLEAATADRFAVPTEAVVGLLLVAGALAVFAWRINAAAKRAADPIAGAERALTRRLGVGRKGRHQLAVLAEESGVHRVALLVSPTAMRRSIESGRATPNVKRVGVDRLERIAAPVGQRADAG